VGETSNRLERITSRGKRLEPDDQSHDAMSGRWNGIGRPMKWSSEASVEGCVRRRWRRIVEYVDPRLPAGAAQSTSTPTRRSLLVDLGKRLRFGSCDPGYDLHQEAR